MPLSEVPWLLSLSPWNVVTHSSRPSTDVDSTKKLSLTTSKRLNHSFLCTLIALYTHLYYTFNRTLFASLSSSHGSRILEGRNQVDLSLNF